MAYVRKTVTDGVTVMNQELYDNVQDGVDSALQIAEQAVEQMEEVNAALQQKVDVQTCAPSEIRVYSFNGKWQDNTLVSATPRAGAIPMYDPIQATLQSGVPVLDKDCVRKVDLKKYLPIKEGYDWQDFWEEHETCKEQGVRKHYFVRKVSDNRIEVFVGRYDEAHDLQIVFASKAINGLMDLYGWYKIPNTSDSVSTGVGGAERIPVVSGEADWLSSHVVYAATNVDGDFESTDEGHPSGGRCLCGSASTARTVSVRVFADQCELADGESAYASDVKLVWTNYLQGSNTQRADGTGREIVSETFTVTMADQDVAAVHVSCEICAMEPVRYREYGGMQMYNDADGSIYFVGSTTKRGPHAADQVVEISDLNCRMIRQVKQGDVLEMEVDGTFDLGTQALNATTGSAQILNGNMSGMRLIHQPYPYDMAMGDKLRWRGVYRMYPAGGLRHTVSYMLDNVRCSVADTEIAHGVPFRATLQPLSGYELNEYGVVIAVNGLDLTPDVYDNGKVYIPCVAGDLFIFASGEYVYTNYMFSGVDQSGKPYNGIGYRDGIKLSLTDGSESNSKKEVSTTGYIAVPQQAEIYLSSVFTNDVTHALVFYDANKNFVGAVSMAMIPGDELYADDYLMDMNGNVTYVNLTKAFAYYASIGRPVAYMRGTFGYIRDGAVLTINQEIKK